MAETGPFSIPLECYTKKAIINVTPRVLDMGSVILGESATHHVTVVNDGALPVPFTVTRTCCNNQLLLCPLITVTRYSLSSLDRVY
jgi:hypothetical protein